MTKSVFLFSFIFVLSGKLLSQENSTPFLSGHENSFQQYFDSVNKIRACELSTFSGEYNFYIVFNVNKKGKTGELEFYQVPGNEVPNKIRDYVRSLIRSTEGKWVVDSLMDSYKIVCNVIVISRNANINELANVNTKIISFVVWNHDQKYQDIGSKLWELEKAKGRRNIIINY